MNRSKTPLLPVIAVSLALLVGVSFPPAFAAATDSRDEPENSGQIFVGRDGLTALPDGYDNDNGDGRQDDGGWDADPDWFQIDTWNGHQLELEPEAPSHDESQWNRFVSWLKVLLDSASMGFGR